MKVLISGASGMIGTELTQQLAAAGAEVHALVRRPAKSDREIQWDPAGGTIEADKLEGFDAVVHLAGANIAAGRWTDKFKAIIRDSRIDGTSLLAKSLAKLKNPPSVFVSTSAIGYYGDRADEEMVESSEPATDYLADVCKQWESAADPARESGIRVVHPRIGVVLSSQGGALAKMLLPFRLCAGGIVGSGKQYWSWIGLKDVAGAIQHMIQTESLAGPVNCVSPNSVTNREFTKTLGSVLKRPTIFPMPAFMVKLIFGEMGEALMLYSTRVVPQKLMESGYQYSNAELADCLRESAAGRM